jgi:hypothetical protein
MHNNVMIFNAGGIYAWYPTSVKHHIRNPELGDRDILGEIVEAAHDEGMRFVARVDFSLADDSVFQHHPEWFARDVAGEPMLIGEPRPGRWSKLYATCPNGPYRNEGVAFPVLAEIVEHYPVDGLFINAAHFRPCWCSNCRRLYREQFDAELPVTEDWQDDNWLRWIEWRYDCLATNFGAMHNVIRSINPDLLWTSELGAVTGARPWQSGHDLVRLAANCTLLTTGSGDNIAAGRPPTWLPAVHAKFARTLNDPVVPWATVHPAPGLVWRHTGLPVSELRLWLAQVNAHGAYAWHAMTGIPETHYDRRNLPIHTEFNAFIKQNEHLFVATTPVAPIAVLWSRRSLERYGQTHPTERWQHEFFGFCDALLHHHLPFTVIPEEYLNDEQLQNFDVLVLPGAACISSDEALAIDRFVQRGGGLVATAATGLYDERGRRRATGLIGDTLGIEYNEHVLQDLVASYARIEEPAHTVFADIGQTQLIPNEFSVQLVQVNEETTALMTLVPTFAPASGVGTPPERASIPTPQTDIPILTIRQRVAYFANEIGRLAWHYKLPDHADLIVGAVRAVLPKPLPVEIEAPHGVQLSLFRQSGRLIIHLVNANADRPRADVIPIHDIQIWINDAAPYVSARAAALGQDLPIHRENNGNRLSVVLPELHTWEIISLEFTAPGEA